ncbi:MAG: metallophosphoesterase [Bacteroidota bacterium]
MKNTLTTIFALLLWVSASFAQPNALQIDSLQGPHPWSNLDINQKDGQFQFAIVTDRTGGARPGVFHDGIRKLNVLQPEFVLSVGDLIEGYTTDVGELNRQWDEFNGFVDELQMPFFYLPGNHDITNQVMEDLYMQKFGKAYYHFIYHDVLFLCLNTEDQRPGAGRGTISQPQLDYIRKTLEENEQVKWTLVFMHQPLWTQPDQSLWPEVEKLLAYRRHTVFTGHVHHYVKYKRNKHKYFTLGTTGGGSPLRGPEMGEFDHLTWVTMTDEGPIIANLELNGIWDEDVSTEATREYAMKLLESNAIQVEPLYVGQEGLEEGLVKIKVTNDENVPLTVKMKESFSWGLKGELDKNSLIVPPNSVAYAELQLVNKRRKSKKANDDFMRLKFKMAYKDEKLPDFQVPLTVNIGPEKKYELVRSKKAVTVDGRLDEWSDLTHKLPGDNGQQGDGSARFDLSYDDEFVYFAAEIKDGELLTDTGNTVWNQDFVGLVINADPAPKSVMDNGAEWYSNSLLIMQAPWSDPAVAIDNIAAFGIEGLTGNCRVVKGGYVMELALPISYLKERQGENWRSLRFNLVVQDVEKAGVQQFTFQPDWRGSNNRVGSGMFFRK